ncbi:Multidrug resistance protein MexA precursor [Vibrio ruber DSM 16370]|uniref:Multidrug resistance protein MexA n=1 Tax=Vibrio ruber (strain DSM 16370 / JCM 11486 / BCRC 17186 / CECT 7878 / LMG 23124 / VR1) TaxID=1123498 RepID=A0A1R4LD62_VIBR1|nr:efflux RND transporter periplasmic adaptor subunit [Vibrio ruber]SJN54349.1 Multidrug resistance protein MexA precursor [Vibrio ruber DSM 16370]
MTKTFPFYRRSLVAFGLVFTLAGCQPDGSQAEATAPQKPQAVAVDAVAIQYQPVELTTRLPGRTSAYRVAEVRPQVAGIIIKRLFVEGSLVKKGEVLYQIDPATYEATLDSAKASLASAQATLEKAKLQAERYQTLVKSRAISEQDYEDSRATYREALAAVMSAEASVKSAQINLDYTHIKAPISGRIGKSSVTEGALVTTNQTNYLATIQQLDPLYVDLSQSSNELLKLRKQTVGGDKKLSGIKLSLDDGTQIEQEATLQFADVTVNEKTGTVNLRALLPNPDQVLLPGLYVRADVPTEYREKAILVPQAAVVRDAQGQAHVMVINAENKVEDHVITTNRIVGTQWLVDSGLKAGDKVIVNGLQKIRPGAMVTANMVEQGQ